MADPVLHELAHHVPGYIAGPGGEDVLFSFLSIFLLVTVTLIGVLYFKLHALPEKMAHNENHAQFQLVGVLSLLALFTHNNIFWIAALLLAADRGVRRSAVIGAIAMAVVLVISGFWSAPAHAELADGFDPAVHSRLMTADLVRTIAWTIRGVVAVDILRRVVRPRPH